MASNAILFITLSLIITTFMHISFAFDPSPLQDFCVADYTAQATCNDPKTVTANDFFASGLNMPANTSNPYGAGVITASVATVPGFNGQGQTLVRADMAANGFFPPHIHPRASEVVVMTKGTVEVGFITSYPDYKYYSKILKEGDVFIFPVGLVHQVRNVAKRNSVVLASFNSQNPGFSYIPDNLFAAEPPVDSAFLAAAFKLDENTVKNLQMKSWIGYSMTVGVASSITFIDG